MEGQPARMAPPPKPPTGTEIALHNRTHIPPRRWCKYFVAGITVDDKHKPLDPQKSLEGPPTVQLDYTFISDIGKTEQLKCLSMAEVRFGGITCSVVAREGADQFTEPLVLNTLEKWGLQFDLIMQGDSESSLRHVIRKIAAARMGRTIVRSSPKGSTGSLGKVERCNRSINGPWPG